MGAVGNIYTACSSGCNYVSVADALAAPGLSQDTIQLTSGYVFNPVNEGVAGSIPDNVTMSCLAGADTFGDAAEPAFNFSVGGNTIIEHCTFENTHFDASGKTNVQFDDNTFTSAALSSLTFTNANIVSVTDNHGIQKVQLQTADNVTISGNSFACRFDNSCINVVTAGVPDYSLSFDISSNVLVTNNTITNYIPTNGGSMINVNGGENVQFTNNTISSAVTLNDVFMIMVTISNAQAEFTGNYVLTPHKIGGANSGTWVFQVNNQSYPANVLFEHNTIYQQNENGGATGDSCIGVFDDGTRPNIPITLTANYNLCYQGTLPLASARGNGFRLEYTIGSANISLTESYNGFYNVLNHMSDITGTYATVSPTTVTSNPLFRRENVDTTDDLHLNPVSRYLDVNGTNDIGAYSAVRGNSFHIVNGGTVDYTTVHATDTYPLMSNLKNGDMVTFATGSYTPIHMTADALLSSGMTISGAGDTTTFNSGGSTSPLSITSITNSVFSNLKVLNSVAPSTTTYEATFAQFTDGVTVYDQAVNLGIPNKVIFFTGPPIANACNSIQPDVNVPFDITAEVNAAPGNLNLFLVDYLGSKLTLMGPSNYVDSISDLEGCATPGFVTVEKFVPDILTRSGGVYTYNAAAAALAGVSSKVGDVSPISITRTIIAAEEAGILLNNSSNNTISNVTSSGNEYALIFKGSSANNVVQNSHLETSTLADVWSLGTGNNTLADTIFNRATSVIAGAGNVLVKFSVRGEVKSGGAPVSGATVSFRAADLTTTNVSTNGTGFTPYTTPLAAYIMSSGSVAQTAGGFNPYTMIVGASTGFTSGTSGFTLNTPLQNVLVNVGASAAPSGNTGGGGGGGFSAPGDTVIVGTGGIIRPAAPEVVESNVCSHYYLKYILLGAKNNIVEVIRLQQFLKYYAGFSDIKIRGIYDVATFNAVMKFQEKFKNDIFTTAARNEGYGDVLASTLQKMNNIMCDVVQ